jgi:hypothetical protein
LPRRFRSQKALISNNRKNSRFYGNNREFAAGETGGGAGCNGADLPCLQRIDLSLPTAGTQPIASDGVPPDQAGGALPGTA